MTQERHLGHVLYLLPNRDLADCVARFFTQRVPRVYFGLAQGWHAQVLQMPVLAAAGNKRISLREGLGRSVSFHVV
jgi:hypothetical protein